MAAKVKWAKFSVVVEMTCFCVSYVSKRSGMWSSVCPHATARRPICNAVATLPTKSGSHFSVELNASQSLFSFRAPLERCRYSPRYCCSHHDRSLLRLRCPPFHPPSFTVSMAKYCRHVKFSNLSVARRQNPPLKSHSPSTRTDQRSTPAAAQSPPSRPRRN